MSAHGRFTACPEVRYCAPLAPMPTQSVGPYATSYVQYVMRGAGWTEKALRSFKSNA